MSQTVDVGALFQTAADEGAIGASSLNILSGIDDIGARIQAGLGTPAGQVIATESMLVTGLIDDSSSISSLGNTQAVIDGHNVVIDQLLTTKQRSGILFSSQLLNGGLICPYTPLDKATRLDQGNYRPSGVTPLYDQTLVILGTVLAKAQEFTDNAIPCRTVTLIVTDGEDVGSKHSAKHVEAVVQDMLMAETHIIMAMGIGSTPAMQAKFRSVFQEMGIRPQWILTPKATRDEIKAAFQVASQSAVRASQNAVAFSTQAVGGFGS
jgi:hypothetical protein